MICCGCCEFWGKVVAMVLLFFTLVYTIKFLYMVNSLGEDPSELIQSEKFWMIEEIWWGVGFSSTVCIYIGLFILYLLFNQFMYVLGVQNKKACKYCCPTVYYICCQNDVERALSDAHENQRLAHGGHGKVVDLGNKL